MVPCTRSQEIDVAEFAVDPRAPAWAEFRDHYPRCPECAREVARFATLKLVLADEAAAASAHLSEADLVAFATVPTRLAVEDRVRLEAHLAGCAPCRTELAVARGFRGVPAAPTRSGWREWLGGLLAPALWRPALVAAVIALLAVPAAWLVWRRAQEVRAVPSPPTAEVERGVPGPELAKAPPATPAPPEPQGSAVAVTPPHVPPTPTPEGSSVTREEPPAAPAPRAKPKPTEVAEASPVPKSPSVAEQPPAPKPPAVAEQPAVAKPPVVAKRVPAAPPVAGRAPKAKRPEPSRPFDIATLLPTELPRYVPGPLASSPSVRIGGAARSLGAAVPAPEALGPVHVGASSRESPNLYWFLAQATSAPVEVTVVDPGAETPLLELTLPAPLAAGVHRVSLAEHGVRLAPGTEYRWFVALVLDPERRSQDAVSGAAIRYVPPAPEQGARLSAAPPARSAHLYAESGYWYDAFDELSLWLAAEPGAARLHDHRAALLEQVGLDDAAAFERRGRDGED
jgi:hypothetical protein